MGDETEAAGSQHPEKAIQERPVIGTQVEHFGTEDDVESACRLTAKPLRKIGVDELQTGAGFCRMTSGTAQTDG